MTVEQTIEKARRRLGRGLSSLIGEPVAVAADRAKVSDDLQSRAGPALNVAPAPDPGVRTGGITFVDLDAVVPSPFQPRRELDAPSLERLADSIRRSGVMQPVIVRPLVGAAAGGGDRYELVAGERRWRAARLAGLARMPAVVRDLSDAQSAEWALVENLQREDLNAMDRARSLRALCDRFGLSHADAAARVGLDRSSVANLVRLLELEDPIASLIASGRLGAGHGKALLAMPPGDARVALAARAAAGEWSVRRLEREASRAAPDAGGRRAVPSDARSAARADAERRLSEHLGTKVAVATDRSGTRGRIIIEFFDLDHFDALMSKFGIRLNP